MMKFDLQETMEQQNTTDSSPWVKFLLNYFN